MSSSFGSDIHRLLQAAEEGQRADILTYSSGHLGPRSLSRGRPQGGPRQPLWRVPPRPDPPIPRQTQTKALTYIKKTGMKEPPLEMSTGTASLQAQVVMSRRDQAADRSSCAGTKERASPPQMVHRRSDSAAFSQKESNSPSDPEEKQKFCCDQEGEDSEEDQLQTTQFGRQVRAKRGLWAAGNVAEIHERKLEKELKKLPAQSRPSRDRLAVFSDVFDDVCEDSPVFGRILREIKAEYDLYVDHMVASHSALQQQLSVSFRDGGALEEAEMRVCRLEQEARGALQENRRVRHELQTVPAIERPEDTRNTSLSVLQDGGTAGGCTGSVRSKRLEVLNMWTEIRQLEEEINKTLVSSDTTTANERHMKELKTEIMKLTASNNRLITTNKDLENSITAVLNREKAGRATRRTLWDQIHWDLQAE